MEEYTILVVEDQKTHFESIRDYLTDICGDMRIAPTVVRVTLKPAEIAALKPETDGNGEQQTTKEIARGALIRKIDGLLASCKDDGVRVILFFDNLMQMPGGRFYLEDYILTLWNQPASTWEASVPIIVYSANSAHPTRDALLNPPDRRKSAVVSAIPDVGEGGLQALERAVRESLR